MSLGVSWWWRGPDLINLLLLESVWDSESRLPNANLSLHLATVWTLNQFDLVLNGNILAILITRRSNFQTTRVHSNLTISRDPWMTNSGLYDGFHVITGKYQTRRTTENRFWGRCPGLESDHPVYFNYLNEKSIILDILNFPRPLGNQTAPTIIVPVQFNKTFLIQIVHCCTGCY